MEKMNGNGKEVNIRTERIRGVCQILADWYDGEQQPEKAMVFRRVMASDKPLEKLPTWAYKQAVNLLRELQRDAEAT